MSIIIIIPLSQHESQQRNLILVCKVNKHLLLLFLLLLVSDRNIFSQVSNSNFKKKEIKMGNI